MCVFSRSDVGAQAAWKGFSSQTLYIASRLISDKGGYEYYPEDIEDLVIKKDGVVIEAVQVKNVSADLTLSSLASTKTSREEMDSLIVCAVCIIRIPLLGALKLSILMNLELNFRKYKVVIRKLRNLWQRDSWRSMVCLNRKQSG